MVVSPLIATGALLRRCGDGRGLVDEATALLDQSARPLHSRVHALRSLDRIRPGLRVWLKRDDELSFGASGSKVHTGGALGLLKYLECDRHAAGHRAGAVDSEGESDED